MAANNAAGHTIAYESMVLKFAGNDPQRLPTDPLWTSMYGVLVDFGATSGTGAELRLFKNVQESATEQVSFTASETIPVRALRKISPLIR